MMIYADFCDALRDVNYKDWSFHLNIEDNRYYLQLVWWTKDTTTDQFKMQSSRKWRLSPHMTKSEFVQTCFKAVLTAEEHEARELFKYRDVSIFGPHHNVDALVEFVKNNKEAKRS